MLRVNSNIIKKIDELNSNKEMKEFLKWILAHVRDTYDEDLPTFESRRVIEQKLSSLLGENLIVEEKQ